MQPTLTLDLLLSSFRPLQRPSARLRRVSERPMAFLNGKYDLTGLDPRLGQVYGFEALLAAVLQGAPPVTETADSAPRDTASLPQPIAAGSEGFSAFEALKRTRRTILLTEFPLLPSAELPSLTNAAKPLGYTGVASEVVGNQLNGGELPDAAMIGRGLIHTQIELTESISCPCHSEPTGRGIWESTRPLTGGAGVYGKLLPATDFSPRLSKKSEKREGVPNLLGDLPHEAPQVVHSNPLAHVFGQPLGRNDKRAGTTDSEDRGENQGKGPLTASLKAAQIASTESVEIPAAPVASRPADFRMKILPEGFVTVKTLEPEVRTDVYSKASTLEEIANPTPRDAAPVDSARESILRVHLVSSPHDMTDAPNLFDPNPTRTMQAFELSETITSGTVSEESSEKVTDSGQRADFQRSFEGAGIREPKAVDWQGPVARTEASIGGTPQSTPAGSVVALAPVEAGVAPTQPTPFSQTVPLPPPVEGAQRIFSGVTVSAVVVEDMAHSEEESPKRSPSEHRVKAETGAPFSRTHNVPRPETAARLRRAEDARANAGEVIDSENSIKTSDATIVKAPATTEAAAGFPLTNNPAAPLQTSAAISSEVSIRSVGSARTSAQRPWMPVEVWPVIDGAWMKVTLTPRRSPANREEVFAKAGGVDSPEQPLAKAHRDKSVDGPSSVSVDPRVAPKRALSVEPSENAPAAPLKAREVSDTSTPTFGVRLSRPVTTPLEPRMVMEQVLQKLPKATRWGEMNLQLREAKSDIRIQLKPDHLGQLRLRVEIENSTLAAKIQVERSDVKSILEASLPELRDALAVQGLRVERVEITLAPGHAWSRAGDEGPSHGRYSDRFFEERSPGRPLMDHHAQQEDHRRRYGYNTMEFIA